MEKDYMPVYEEICCTEKCAMCPVSHRSAVCWFEVPVKESGAA